MRKTKFFIAALMFIFSAGLFAQNAEYKALMNKAKTAEANKEWVYAMGYYLDAIDADPYNSKEAKLSYEKIAEALKEGKPGIKADGGKYNPFEEYEEWTNVLVNAEKYWTEYCPYNFIIGKLEMGVPDMKTKTAEYRSKISVENSYKYELIMESLIKGYEKAYKKGWEDLPRTSGYNNYYSDCWPVVSVNKIADTAEKEVTVAKDYFNNGGKVKTHSLVKDKNSYYYNKVAVYGWPDFVRAGTSYTNNYYKELGVSNYYNAFAVRVDNYFMYDLKVRIVDEKGNVLAAGKRFLPKYKSYYDSSDDDEIYVSFNGITQTQMNLIDSGKAWADLEGVYLQYGYQIPTDYRNYYDGKTTNKTDFKKGLPELNIPLSKVAVTNISAEITEKLRMNFYVSKVMETYKIEPFEKIVGNKLVKYIRSNRDRYYYEYDYEGVSPIISANVLSTYYKLKPYYDNNLKPLYTNGFHLITDEEQREFNFYNSYYFVAIEELSPSEAAKKQLEIETKTAEINEKYIKAYYYDKLTSVQVEDSTAYFVNTYFFNELEDQGYYFSSPSDTRRLTDSMDKVSAAYVCNVMSRLAGVNPYYDDEGNVLGGNGFRYVNNNTNEYIKYIKPNHERVYMSCWFFRLNELTPEEKAAILAAVTEKGNSILEEKNTQLAYIKSQYGNDEASTIQKYEQSIAKLSMALNEKNIQRIKTATADVEKIDLQRMYAIAQEREAYFNESARMYEEKRARLDKVISILGNTSSLVKNYETVILKFISDIEDKNYKQTQTSKKKVDENEKNLVSLEAAVSKIEEDNENIQDYFDTVCAHCDYLEKVLGPEAVLEYSKAIEGLKNSMDFGSKLEISNKKAVVMKINTASLDEAAAKAHEEKYAALIKKAGQDSEVVAAAESLVLEDSKLKTEIETAKKVIDEIKNIDKTNIDLIYSMSKKLEECNVQAILYNVKRERFEAYLKDFGITLLSSKTIKYENQDVFCISMNIEKGSKAEKMGLKKSDFFFVPAAANTISVNEVKVPTHAELYELAVSQSEVGFFVYYLRGKKVNSLFLRNE